MRNIGLYRMQVFDRAYDRHALAADTRAARSIIASLSGLQQAA